MKLPGRDFSVAEWGADDLDIEAARLLRQAKDIVAAKDADLEARRRKTYKRSQVVYGAVLCATAAKEMRKRKVEQYRSLPQRHQRAVIKRADSVMADLALGRKTPDQIFEP